MNSISAFIALFISSKEPLHSIFLRVCFLRMFVSSRVISLCVKLVCGILQVNSAFFKKMNKSQLPLFYMGENMTKRKKRKLEIIYYAQVQTGKRSKVERVLYLGVVALFTRQRKRKPKNYSLLPRYAFLL